MRKIISKQEEARKRKRNQIIAGGVMIAVMLLSTLGYAFENYLTGNTNSNTGSNSTQTRSYNGINFVNQNGYWVTNYSNHRVVFSYFPGDIPLLNANLTSTINDFAGKPLYIYSENGNATSEVQFNLIQFASSVIPIQNIPDNCANNTIIIQNGQSNVNQNQNCIYISGEGQDLIMNIDSVLFKLFGITQ